MLSAFRISLTGAEQVPVVATSATGLGMAVFDSAATSLFYTITTRGLDWGPALGRASQTPSTLDDINGQHFHSGARGVNGGVVFDWLSQDTDDFNATLNTDGSWTISGRWETTDPGSTIASFAGALGSTAVGADAPLYANIHTVANGGGEIRGQLVGANTWNGTSSPTKWSVAANWSNGIPQATDDVVIPAGTATPLLDDTTGSTTVASVAVANGASFDIKTTGAAIIVTGNFTDDGGVGVDSTAFDPGGTTVAIGGTLTVTNAGAGFAVGNYLQGSDNTNPQPHGTPSTTTVTAASVTNTGTITIQSYDALGSVARVLVASAAGFGGQAGVLTGNVNIGTNGLHAGSQGLLQFASGQITTIGTGAKLNLYGDHAFIASGGATSSNSAITGLSNINGSGGLLKLQNNVEVSTGALTVAAGGSIAVDNDFLGTAGSTLTIGGQLTNNGTLGIGRSAMTGDALVTVNSLSNTGTISLSGDTGTNSIGRLVVNAAAGFGTAGVLTGNVNMEGKSVLEFASGQITTIASGAVLNFNGANAFIADTGATTSNSALTGLTTVSGSLLLQNSVALAISGGLTIGGTFVQDTGFLGNAGSNTTVGGTLTVNGSFTIGREAMVGDTTVTVGELAGTGSISLNGDVGANFTGRLIVNAAAPGTITNDITVQGKSLLQFASGQVNTIAFGGSVSVNGPNAFIADVGSTSSNSALTGLSTAAGALALHSGATISTAGGLTVGNGVNGTSLTADGGSALTINGTLVNNANCTVIVGAGGDAVSSTVTATGLTNAGAVNVNGNAVYPGNLVINGAAVNTNQINLTTGTVHITGALSGAGTVSLNNGGVLQLDSSSSGGAINFGAGQSTLKVGSAAVSNALTGFDAGDTIDLMGQVVTGLSYSGSTLTANIQGGGTKTFSVTGTFNGFSATSDGSGGTNVAGFGTYTFTAGADVVAFAGGNDTMNGGAGNDVLNGGAGIDTAVFSGNRAAYTITRSGATTTVTGPDGTDTLTKVERLQFSDTTVAVDPAGNDFNGDGKSDVLFSNQGAVYNSNYEWQLNDRSLLAEGAIDLYDPAFNVQIIGDYDGDGMSDVLFQNPNTGGVWEWQLNGTSIVSQGAVDVGDPTFDLLGAGDFNGDGKDDVLFRNDAGFVYQWQMNGRVNTPLAVGPLDPVWHVQGTGDFNGDGRDDILLRNISAVPNENGAFFLWQMNGNVIESQGGIERPSTAWKTLGIGDFDGDGKDDFAVRNESATSDNGAVWVYLMNGTTIKSQGAAGIADAATWHLQQIADLNGDGKDDILYRNDAGYFYSWDMNGTAIGSEGLLQGAAQHADPSFAVVKPFWDLV